MISKFSVKRPYTVFVCVIAIIVVGVVALTKTTADLLPNITLPYVIVITPDMGASPETVEKEITAPIEASLATTSNLKTIQSMSYNSYSTVVLEYEQTTNMDATLIEIQQKLDQLEGSFDDAVGTPIVMQLNPDMLPVMVAAANVDDMDNIQLTNYINSDIKPQLESIEGVASVTITGGVTESVKVTMNQKKIDALNKKIMDEIEGKFDDSREELDKSKEELESGKEALESGKKTFANTVSDNKTKIEDAQLELYQTESELQNKKEQLELVNEVLTTSIEALQKLYEAAKELSDRIASIESALSLYEQGLLNDEAFLATIGLDPETAKQEMENLHKQIDQYNEQIREKAAALIDYNITLYTYEDIPAAIGELEKARTEITMGIETINKGMEEVQAGKTTTSDALNALNKAEIEQSIQLADASSQLNMGLAQIELAEQNIDSTVETAKDAADLNKVLSLDVLNNLLLAQNFDMPAGYASGDNGQYLVKVGDNIASAEDLRDLVLIDLDMKNVGVIRLSDVADVEEVDDSETVYAKLNGEPGILMSFEKQTGYSTGDVTDKILEKFDSLENTEDEGLHFAVLMDQGVYIDMIVDSILKNILVGAALAILVLIIFLKSFKPTIIIACAIPISIIFAIVLMYFSNITMNIISMSGLTLGIGMLVDNSIVVIENIFRLKKEGEPIKRAAVYGASQVAGAITSSTLTTMCVFLPIVFTEGMTRQLFVDMGLTIAFTLTASLLVALTLVPAMAQGLLRNQNVNETGEEGVFMKAYGKVLRGAIKYKALVFIAMILLLVASVFLALSRGTEFMPEMNGTQLTITMSPPKGEERTFEEMTGYADKLVEKLQDYDEVETIGAMVGNGTMIGGLSAGQGLNSVSIYVLLDQDQKIDTNDIVDRVEMDSQDIDCDVQVSAQLMDMQALTGSGVSIMIKGRDMQTIQSLATEVADSISTIDGIEEVDDGLDNTIDTFVITVDKKKAAKYGLTVAQVFASISAKLASTRSTTSIETDIKDYDVYVQTDEQAEITINDLRKMKIEYVDKMTQEKKEVALSKIASFDHQEELSQINRDQQSRFISVTATLKDDANIGLVGDEVKKKLKDIGVPEGYSITMKGENESIDDAMNQLMLMMLLAVILIYLIMVAQFQSIKAPFIIMFTIPLAFTGGLLSLYIFGKAVSVISVIGFIMLAGIIVNNGIVLVDYIIQLRRTGMAKRDAIITSAKTRLRPVLMTAITTIISMSTMAIGMGQGTEMAQPMAIVVVGGLIYGTVLTLVLVPCMYDAFNREKDMTEVEI